jgi:MoaA/NifB/PqqE/SkfB family radical SAM enzyme
MTSLATAMRYSAPVRASLDITYACDLRCIHCRTNTGEIPIEIRRAMLSNDQLASVIRQLDEMRVFEITLTGGEPTMRKAFWDLLPTLGKLEYSTVTLITNAYALTPEKMDRIVDAGIDSVRVSIDGTREVFEAVRKVDALDIVLENAGYLRERVTSMKVLTTAMKTNYHDLFDLVELLRREGFRRQDLILVRAHGRGGRNRLLLDEDEATDLMRRVQDFRARVRPEEYDLNLNAPFLIPDEAPAGPEDVVLYPYTHKNSSVAISATGDVTMNRLFSPVPVGNVKSRALREIWYAGQDQLEAEAAEFDDDKLRDIFWSFNDDGPTKLTSLLDRQIFENAPVE